MLDIGQQLARVSGDGPAAIRVVGVEEGTNPRYVCQELPFGANHSYSAQELSLLYGAVDAVIHIKTEQESWRELSSRKLHKRNLERIDLTQQQAELPSPEMVFKAQAEAAAKRDRQLDVRVSATLPPADRPSTAREGQRGPPARKSRRSGV